MPLLDSAIQFLGCQDPRDLVQRCTNDLELRKLKSFYKGVLVTVPPNKRRVKIEDIVLRAGHFEFDKSGHMTTIQAGV